MDRAKALLLLPDQYATALRLAGSGASEDTIATALGIEREAVRPLLRIAEAKLERVLADEALRDSRRRTPWEG